MVVVRGRVTARVGIAGALAALLVGCSGGGDSESDAGGGSADSMSVSSGGSANGVSDSAESDREAPRTAGRTAVQTRAVISTGRIELVADDLETARDELDRLLGRYGGRVAKEHTSKDADGGADRSELELRVPSSHFAQLMSDLEEVGTVTDRGTKTVDVTTEVIDVDSRIRTQEVSLDRLRGFLGEATDVNAMIRLESEIAQREADLASLRAQQEYLSDQTSLATISLTMTRDQGQVAAADDPLDHAGFVTGLRNGWEALVSVLVVGATVVGAVIPFGFVLAVLGVPLWLWLRSVRRRRPVAPSETPAG
ncbi:MAG TPA: DUF4349 domain-containing protein [Marmoricola sp.]|nr:DUF4349 domain-containing protein [Marmoricola sp.]